MTESHVWIFLSMGLLLGLARLLGEITKQFGLTSLLGEIMAGVILGPTILGNFYPDIEQLLFPTTGKQAFLFNVLTSVSIALYLFVSGMEVDLSSVWKQGRRALIISSTGVVFPFVVGVAVALALPGFLGAGTEGKPLVFALFWGTALSISALPVIARVLMDLNLYRTDLGMIVMPAAVAQDLFGWCVFAGILSLIGVNGQFGLLETIGFAFGFSLLVIVVLRKIFDRVLPWINAHWDSPGATIGLGISIALLAAAFTEWIGIHALFGAFFVGIALGDSRHVNERTRFAFHEFISYFFAPLFFASIGLKINFGTQFDPLLVVVVLAIAMIGKLGGSLIGGRIAGISRRDTLAIGFAMNARGAMEIILALLALQYAILSERSFVAIVVMAVTTSLISGPAIRRVLQLKRAKLLSDYMNHRTFIDFKDEILDRDQIIARLTSQIRSSTKCQFDPIVALNEILDREKLMPTGIGNGIAIPHARIEGVMTPRLAIGLCRQGVDFNAPDGKPARIVILMLAPAESSNLPLEVFAEIARTFSAEETRSAVLRAGSFIELQGILRQAARVNGREK